MAQRRRRLGQDESLVVSKEDEEKPERSYLGLDVTEDNTIRPCRVSKFQVLALDLGSTVMGVL